MAVGTCFRQRPPEGEIRHIWFIAAWRQRENTELALNFTTFRPCRHTQPYYLKIEPHECPGVRAISHTSTIAWEKAKGLDNYAPHFAYRLNTNDLEYLGKLEMDLIVKIQKAGHTAPLNPLFQATSTELS